MPEGEETQGITPEQLVARYRDPARQPEISALEGLDEIDWGTLEHAYGPASDVPALLRAAFSQDRRDREFAFTLLHQTIWHQGTVYEASAYAVPFLIRALESPETPDKTSIAFLLANLADGSSAWYAYISYDEKLKQTWRKALRMDEKQVEVAIAKGAEYVERTRQAVGKGLHLLFPYLKDKDIFWQIATGLAAYPERRAEILPLLEEARSLIREEDGIEEVDAAIAKLSEL